MTLLTCYAAAGVLLLFALRRAGRGLVAGLERVVERVRLWSRVGLFGAVGGRGGHCGGGDGRRRVLGGGARVDLRRLLDLLLLLFGLLFLHLHLHLLLGLRLLLLHNDGWLLDDNNGRRRRNAGSAKHWHDLAGPLDGGHLLLGRRQEDCWRRRRQGRRDGHRRALLARPLDGGQHLARLARLALDAARGLGCNGQTGDHQNHC